MTRKSYKKLHDFKRKMANNFFVYIYAVKLLLDFSIYHHHRHEILQAFPPQEVYYPILRELFSVSYYSSLFLRVFI